VHTSAALVSVVVPAFREAGNLTPLHEELVRALAGERWELILVDDGSTDGTWDVIESLAQADPRVRGVRLSRNFGHQPALLAGLAAAQGQAVISMDADLQHPPALLPELLARWRAGAQIVHTQRKSGAETSWFKRSSSRWYYVVFSMLTGVPLAEGQSDFRLLDRRVVGALQAMDEVEVFLRGMVQWVGFRSVTVPYEVRARHSGESKFGLLKMVRFGLHGVTSFSTIPLRAGIALGFLTAAAAFCELAYVVAVRLLGAPVPGWASVLGIVAMLFGVNFMLMGFQGIYLGHVFSRVRRRPTYLISDTVGDLNLKGRADDHD